MLFLYLPLKEKREYKTNILNSNQENLPKEFFNKKQKNQLFKFIFPRFNYL